MQSKVNCIDLMNMGWIRQLNWWGVEIYVRQCGLESRISKGINDIQRHNGGCELGNFALVCKFATTLSVTMGWYFNNPVVEVTNDLVCHITLRFFFFSQDAIVGFWNGLYKLRKSFPSKRKPQNLGGGFKYFLFSPLFGEDSHFD